MICSWFILCPFSGGSDFTQAHKYKDFTFTTYSPVAFRFFREAFQIKAEDYLVNMSVCFFNMLSFYFRWHFAINSYVNCPIQEQVVLYFISQQMTSL